MEQPSAWRTDSSRLRHHFLSKFGGWAMADMGTERGEQAVLDWLVGLRSHTARQDGQPIASRTAWSTWSIVKVFFADARERRVIARSPCDGLRPRKHLPVKVDKVKGFRETAGFDLEQVVVLTSDQRVPLDRRVYYGLGFLGGGLRPSSRAIARWKDLDRTKVPLWRLSITGAYDSANRLEKQRTKTGATYHVPVHPVLQAMLEAWWSGGWEAYIGRPPRPDDFIVPRQDGQPRRVDFTLEQFHGDLDRLGMPRQRQYESRATFRTLALDGGADSAQVDAITHPSIVIGTDFYRRLEREWRARCAAVLGIDSGAWRPGLDAAAPSRSVADGTDRVDLKGPGSVPVPVAGYSPGDSVLRVGLADLGIPQGKTPPTGRALAGRDGDPYGN